MSKVEFESDPKIGTLGERTFSSWCAAAQLTCNGSLEEDRTGWDFQVEFPYIKTDLPKDMQPSPIECKVQVKSTQRKDRGLSIKASVLKRMVDYSYPAFFLFLEYSEEFGNEEPVVENAFLVHVDEKLIEKTLKAIRENDTSESPKALHKLKIYINYTEKYLLVTPSGIPFREAVLTHVPNADIKRYQDLKRKVVEEAGYNDTDSYRLKFDIKPEELDKHILNASIGLTSDPLTIKNSVLYNNRFNLENGAVEINRASEAQLTISPNIVDSCQIRFKESEYATPISFNGEFLSSVNIYDDLKCKLFIRTKLFSMELRDCDEQGRFDASLHFTLDKSVPLDDVISMFQLFQRKNCGKQMICQVELLNNARAINFTVGMEHDFEDASHLVQALRVIKDRFNLDSSVLTTTDEMFNQRHRLIAFAGALQKNVDNCRIRFKNEDLEMPEEITTPYSIGVVVGDKALAAICVFHGSKFEENHYRIDTIEILEELLFQGGLPSDDIFNEIEKKALEKYQEDNPE
ncbi:TPA: hypothetical protein ACX3IO_003944 [Vibrio parahaemolyticus]